MAHVARTLLLAVVLVAAGAAQVPDVSGRWDVVVNTPDGPQTAVLTVQKDGGKLTGTIAQPDRKLEVTGTQTGADVVITFTFPTSDGPLPITFRGVQEGDAIKGEATFGDEKGTWSAKRATSDQTARVSGALSRRTVLC